MRYFMGAAHEQFPPEDLLRQAVEAERAGFDGVAGSDHLQPWWEPGESGHAWVWLGAVGQATERVALGTAVTPPGPRYHPVLIAQAWATLERMFPDRPFLGIGSGESLNESPLGAEWPSVGEQIERMEEALEIIHALFEGKRLSGAGKHFSTDGAYLHTRPERRPPIYVSAFGPKAAAVAGRRGDGIWTLGDPATPPAAATASGPSPPPSRPRRSSRPAAPPPPTPGSSRARSCCRRPSPGPGTTTRRWRARGSRRARRRRRSTKTTGSTRRRCTSAARNRFPTRTCAPA